MPYVEGRTVHDADSHIFEPPGHAEEYADPRHREALRAALRSDDRPSVIDKALAKQHDPDWRAKDGEETLPPKNHVALGAMRSSDRPQALDHLGFASQLVFTTTYLGPLRAFDRADDVDLAYALATGHNRGMVDFCSVDRRLLPVCYVPFTDIDRAADAAREAIDLGAAALMIASHAPQHHSQSHVGFDRVWAQAQEAGVPIVSHVA